MKYAKPEINILDSASRVIQGTQKAHIANVDANPPDMTATWQFTVNAYQSDE